MITIHINGRSVQAEAEPDMPLLWFIRDIAGLHGTKFGCGIARCGACTVHLDGQAVRSCVTPVKAAEDKPVTTIEGLDPDGEHVLQQAWRRHDVPQCGYCQSGQLMQAATLLRDNANPSRRDILDHMSGNICRCGTYQRIIAAIEDAAGGEDRA